MNKYTITFKSGLVFVTRAESILFEKNSVRLLINGLPRYYWDQDEISKIEEKISKTTCNN